MNVQYSDIYKFPSDVLLQRLEMIAIHESVLPDEYRAIVEELNRRGIKAEVPAQD